MACASAPFIVRNAKIGAGTRIAAFSQIEDTVMGRPA